jgi:hypothetical protein
MSLSSFGVGLIAFACLFGGVLAGMRIRHALPGHHLADDSRHLIELGLGIIGTMAGLVLGLLVGSGTASYNAQRNELLEAASRTVLLDRLLAHYGPEANDARRVLRSVVVRTLNQVWPQAGAARAEVALSATHGEAVLDKIEDLTPTTELQRTIKQEALAQAIGVAQVRWLMFEQSGSGVSWPLLILLIFWFTITFIGFGLFAPKNATVSAALFLAALAVSGAIAVTLAMYSPFQGVAKLSSAPLREALTQLGAPP